jgi:cyanuric acid amidohydrolase
MKIGVYKVAMASPSDVSELTRLIDSHEIDPAEIVALIGKTEGNGGANDFTRGFATLSHQLMLASRLGLSEERRGFSLRMPRYLRAHQNQARQKARGWL